MEYSIELLNDDRVKITILKNQKGVNSELLKKIIDKKMFGIEQGEELKTRFKLFYKTCRNRYGAVMDYGSLFIATYELLQKDFTEDGMKKIEEFLNKKVEELSM